VKASAEDEQAGGPDDEFIVSAEGRPMDRRGRFTHCSFEPLPDLAAGLSAVPGGLGTALPDSFRFASVQWTAGDARLDGSPIGASLAAELAQSANDSSWTTGLHAS
jgi:hypothetical protein